MIDSSQQPSNAASPRPSERGDLAKPGPFDRELYRPSKLGRWLLRNAGARKGVLLREEGGRLRVEALAAVDCDEVRFPQCMWLDSCRVVSQEIVRYVSRTGETVVLGDASRDNRFGADPYLRRRQPLSVVCTPILHLGRRVGILYLENDEAADAFADDKLDEVAVVSSYAATAIENTRLRQALIDSEQFLLAVVDAMPSNVAILDTAGNILSVNSAWRRFADANGLPGSEHGLGMNYVEVCDRASQMCPEAKEAAAGIRAVAERRCDDFFLEYTCHGPAEKSWFQMRVIRFRDRRAEHLLVAHQPITEIKLAQEELNRALEEIAHLKDRLQAENLYLHEELRDFADFNEIVGTSPALRAVLRKLEQVAPTDATVLILGETGTGKELVARAIHNRSRRAEHTLVRVNCASLPATLIESELFGHEKGAFTGALTQRIGRFELADGGTIFLDEVGDLPLELQAKLLRVIQEGEFERLGSSTTIKVDVRMIAATNHNLEQAVAEGKFRADLYYRLKVFPIVVPPLRERLEDIPLLVWYFIAKKQTRLGKSVNTIKKNVMDALMNYCWPGNIRELENAIEHALIISPGSALTLDEPLGNKIAAADHGASDDKTLAEAERAHVVKVLEACKWKVKGKGNAAERLGLHPNTLRYRIKKLGIKSPAS
jgi:transcriptional regulator with GAF, ATPase, and Fis domain